MKWIDVVEPILWHGNDSVLDIDHHWTGWEDLNQRIYNQGDLISIGHDQDITPGNLQQSVPSAVQSQSKLLPEIWSLILEFVGDWEVAKSLGIHTSLAIPIEWGFILSETVIANVHVEFSSKLELIILLGNNAQLIEWYVSSEACFLLHSR